MKDRSDDPSYHERTLLPRSYISLLSLKVELRLCSALQFDLIPKNPELVTVICIKTQYVLSLT